MLKDLISNLKVSQLLDPAAVTADVESSSLDRQGYGSLMFLASLGEDGGTLDESNHIQLEVQESDDNSAFTAVADEHLDRYVAGDNDGTFAKVDAASKDDAVYKVEYRGYKRYARVVVNVTGTINCPVAIIGLSGNAHLLPEA